MEKFELSKLLDGRPQNIENEKEKNVTIFWIV